jgi:hypothetical protein
MTFSMEPAPTALAVATTDFESVLIRQALDRLFFGAAQV